jgi:hypothetical protein
MSEASLCLPLQTGLLVAPHFTARGTLSLSIFVRRVQSITPTCSLHRSLFGTLSSLDLDLTLTIADTHSSEASSTISSFPQAYI